MRDNVSPTQWMAVLASSVSAILMMNYIKLFVNEVGRGTYVSAILLALFTLILLLGVISLQKRNDFNTPQQTIGFLLGKKAATIFCAFFALAFFLLAVETLNIFTYIVKFYFLPKTPTLILTIVLFLPSAYMAFCGFRTFGNMASAAIFAFLLFLLMFPFTKNNYFPANVLPWNEFQWTEIFFSLPFLFLSAPAVAASFFVLPYCSEHKKLCRKAIIFSLIFLILMVFIYIAGMMYFGENIIQKLILPFYNLSPFFKGNLLERFDIFYMMALLPTLSIFNAFGFSVFTLIQQDLLVPLNTRHRGKIILFFSAAAVILSALTVNRLPIWAIYRYSNAAALVVVVLLFLIFAAAAIKKRRVTPL